MFPYGLGGMASRFAYNIPSYGFNQPAWQQFGSQAPGGQQYQPASSQGNQIVPRQSMGAIDYTRTPEQEAGIAQKRAAGGGLENMFSRSQDLRSQTRLHPNENRFGSGDGSPFGSMFGSPFGNMFGSPFQWGGGFRQPSPFQYAQQQPYQQPQQFAGNGLYQNRLNSPGAMDAVTQLLQSLQAMKQNRYQNTAQQPVQQPAPGGQPMYRGEYDGFSGRYLDNGQPMLMGRRW